MVIQISCLAYTITKHNSFTFLSWVVWEEQAYCRKMQKAGDGELRWDERKDGLRHEE